MRAAVMTAGAVLGLALLTSFVGPELPQAAAQAPVAPAAAFVTPTAPNVAPLRTAAPSPPAMPPASVAGGDPHGITAVATPLAENRQALTVIDAQRRAIAVYHIDLSTGEITLKSVRQITWDLQLTEFNSGPPTPAEVRAMFPPR